MDPIVDLYCKRLATGLWGEPLNSLTNVAFLIAAWRVRRHQMAIAIEGVDLVALPVLIALIGMAGGLFHTTASAWAGALDSGFIALFMLVYVCVFARRVGALPWRVAWLAASASRRSPQPSRSLPRPHSIHDCKASISTWLHGWGSACSARGPAARAMHRADRSRWPRCCLRPASVYDRSTCQCAARGPWARTSPSI